MSWFPIIRQARTLATAVIPDQIKMHAIGAWHDNDADLRGLQVESWERQENTMVCGTRYRLRGEMSTGKRGNSGGDGEVAFLALLLLS